MYDEALRIDSKYVDALMNRAIAHVSAGKYDCAIADLSQVLVIDPEDLDAYALRAESFEAQGHHEKAEADRRAAARRKCCFDHRRHSSRRSGAPWHGTHFLIE
jgi:Tfp pilus assembly protein PilF